MKKIIYIFLSSVIALTAISGCSDNSLKTNTEIVEKSKAIIKENIQLQDQLQSSEEKLQLLQETHDNELELRNLLDISFHAVIDNLENGNIENIKKNITNNISINKNKIINNSNKTEFILPKGKYYFRQRFFQLIEPNEINKFSTAYEIIIPKSDSLQVCYVDFIKVDGEWKLNSINIDAN